MESGVDVPITSVDQLNEVLKLIDGGNLGPRTTININIMVTMPVPEANILNVGRTGGGLSMGPDVLPPGEGLSWINGMTGIVDQEEEGEESDANSNPSEG